MLGTRAEAVAPSRTTPLAVLSWTGAWSRRLKSNRKNAKARGHYDACETMDMNSEGSRLDGDDLPLFGVVGLQRQPGMDGALGVAYDGRRRRMVMKSRRIGFRDVDGSSIAVTSTPEGDNASYEPTRAWSPMHLCLEAPRGQGMLNVRSRRGKPLEPVAVHWEPVMIRVADQDVLFETCELGDGWWAAIGRVPRSIIALDSRAVPLSRVRLEAIDAHPVPALPNLGTETAAVSEHLGTRFAKTPFHRVHNLADYWALHAVETDHIQSLRHQYNLSGEALVDLQAHWLGRIERELADTSEQLRRKNHEAMLNSRIARRLRGRNFLFQVWSNTVGPGARCWIGNRRTPIRRHTFRLRWRP